MDDVRRPSFAAPAARRRRRQPPQVTVSFDDQNRIRVLDVDKFAHTEELGSAANDFVKKNQEFGGFMDGIVEVLDANAKRIEQAKLRAIGMRNRVITERENRDQKRRALQALVAEREADLARVEAQVKSLRQVEAEQQNIIDKLAVGEAVRPRARRGDRGGVFGLFSYMTRRRRWVGGFVAASASREFRGAAGQFADPGPLLICSRPQKNM